MSKNQRYSTKNKMAEDYVHLLITKFFNDFTATKSTGIPLHDTFEEIHDILQKKPIGPSVNIKNLKDYLFRLHDMFAKCVTLAEENRQRSGTAIKNIVSSSPNRAKELWSLLRVRIRLKEIKKRLIEILAEAAEERAITSSILVLKPEAFQYVDKSEIHGLNDQIIHEIQNSLIKKKALAIVGIGGSGKTVLARSVFHSEMRQHAFELRLWIDLSEATDSQKKYFCILVERLGQIKSPCQYGLDEVLSTLYSYIRNRKCLIVLDGLWHYEKGIEDFIDVIIDKFHGAVIVTTRFLDVATKLVREERLYMIKPLDKEASWSIFKDSISRKKLQDVEKESWSEFKTSIKKKLSQETEEGFHKLEEEIKDRCAGVPLAAKTLAEIMWSLSLETP